MRAFARSLLSLVAGLATAVVLVMLVTYVASLLLVPGFPEDPMAPPTRPYLVANVVGSFLAAVAGGYVAGVVATVASGAEPAPGQPLWYPLTVALLALAGCATGGWLRKRHQAP
jgi:heme A synthase